LPAFSRRGHRVYLIQDNAGDHKKAELYDWFSKNRKHLEVFHLPPYWPELNATEQVVGLLLKRHRGGIGGDSLRPVTGGRAYGHQQE